jgi:fatty-acyl-CoA synthase
VKVGHDEPDASWAHRSIASDLAEMADRTPDAMALVAADGEVSYRDLVALTAGLSSDLIRLGVEGGDRVVIAAPSTARHVAAWYAIIGLGAISVDLNFLLGDDELRHIIRNCSPTVILAEEPHASRLRAIADAATSIVDLGPSAVADQTLTDRAAWRPCQLRSSEPAVIAYTSGTTGLPKGVVHTHAAITAQLDLLQQEVGYDSTWIVYQSIPLFSLQGFLPQVAIAIHVGCSVILANKFDPAEFARRSRQYHISYTTLSSPMVPGLIVQSKTDGLDLSHIRVLSCGGAPLHPQISADFRAMTGVPLTQGYGMTEMLGAFVMDLDGNAPWGASGRVYPRDVDAVCILDDHDDPVGPANSGEIAIRGDFVTQRYWPNERVELSQGSWFRTGDIGRIDENGYLHLLDRKKDVIFRGGFNIYTAEIERVLAADQWVDEAVVVGVADDQVGEVPVAYVVVADGAPADMAESLLADVSSRLGRLKRPEALHIVKYEDLPRNALGKVQKSLLRHHAAVPSLG